MLASYLNMAFRGIARQKGFSFINIAGLAVGIASCVAILLWVVDEVQYDRFHANAEQIYRCYRTIRYGGNTRLEAMMPAPLANALLDRTPEIAECVRATQASVTLRFETNVYAARGRYVDPGFLTLFTFPLRAGDPLNALAAPNSIVLTQETCLRLFGNQDPVGKILENGLMVSGVAENPPRNSSISFDFLVPVAFAEQSGEIDPEDWYSHSFDVFVRLHNSADVAAVGEKIRHVFRDADPERNEELSLQPFTRMHLWNLQGGGRIVYVYVLASVALLLLIVACVNFVNLATARSAKRSKEIGLRKTLGAQRSQLIHQVMIESLVQTLIATILAVCLLDVALPRLDGLFGKELRLEFSAVTLFLLIGVALAAGLLAGSYPALVLSSFRPAAALRENPAMRGFRSMNMTRKALAVFQFAVSFILIFGAVVINGQLALFNTMDLGIDRENIVCIRTDGLERDYDTIRHELLQNQGILGVTATFQPPSYCGWNVQGFGFAGKRPDQNLRAGVIWGDPDYLDVFGLEIIDGRGFRRENGADEERAHIVNETALRAMEMENPVGKMIDISDNPGEIVGVVKDFHFQSLHEDIYPLVLSIDRSNLRYLCVKIAPEEISATLDRIRATWTQFRPGQEFNYRFFEDLLDREYEVERRTGSIVFWFTVVIVILASLGLLGLAVHSTQRRTKEVGIRKVLGASVTSIMGLLTREFLALVVIAAVFATPVAYLGANVWLQSFAYRIELGWTVFVVTFGISLVVAVLTVSHQAVKAARVNPIASLRYE